MAQVHSDHQFFTKQDFHTKSRGSQVRDTSLKERTDSKIQLVNTVIQSCDVQDSGSEEFRKRSVKKLDAINLLPEISPSSQQIAVDYKQNEVNGQMRLSVVSHLKNSSLSGEAVLVVDNNDTYQVDSQQTELVQRIQKQMPRQKGVLSPIPNRPFIQPMMSEAHDTITKALEPKH